MATIANLQVLLGMDASGLIGAVKTAQRDVREMEKAMKPLKEAAKDLGLAFSALGGAVVASMTAMVHSAADYGETLNKAQIQTGIMTEKLSVLKFIAEQEETTFETLTKGLKAMSTNANNNAEAFGALGIKVTDANGKLKPMDGLLLEVSGKLARMEDGTQKNAIASELFGGKLGQELIPTLNRLGREGLGPATDEVRKLGLEMSGDSAKAADEFNDSITQIKAAILGLSNTVASALIPGLTDGSHALRDGIVAAKDFAKEHETLTKAIAITAAALTGAGGLLLGLAGFVSIYPAVVTGLTAIATGIGSISAATVVATAGFAGLLYWMYKIIEAEDDIKKTHDQVADAQYRAVDQTLKNRDALASIGIVIEQNGRTWRQYENSINQAMITFRGQLPKSAAALAAFEIKNKAERIAAAKSTADQLTAIDKKVHEFSTSLLKAEDGLFKANADAQEKRKKEQADALISFDKQISDFQRSIWQADTGIYQLEIEKQNKLKAEQADSLVAITKKISEYNTAVLRAEDGLEELKVKDSKARAKEMAAEAERMKMAMANAMASLATRTAESFADMVVSAKFNFNSLVNIAQTTAKSMLSAFLGGLLNPLTNALGKLGQSLAGSISGAIGLGSTGGSIGLPGIGGIGGGGTGNLLGKGAGSIGVLGLSGAATLGIGAAVLGAALIAKHYIGKGRRTADEFTGTVQNQFGRDLAEVAERGTTADLDVIWKKFNQDANEFASQGKTEAKVVQQAHETLDSIVARVRNDLVARDAANQTVNITVQGNAYAGIEDVIVQAVMNALRDNRGGLATAIG